jgi:phosphomannomutase
MKNQIKFGTDGWRAIIGIEYTADNLRRVVEGTCRYLLKTKQKPCVVLGYDCRFNGKIFAEQVAVFFVDHGVKVYLTPGFVTTPMVSLATLKLKADMGIILTASHNPPEYSGYKLKGPYGGPAYPSIVSEVESFIPDEATSHHNNNLESALLNRKVEYYDAESIYINHIKSSFPLKEIKNANIPIAYDAMYGAGRRVFSKLFPEAKLIHCDDNPGFNGQAPEPVDKNLNELRELCKQESISFGMATDGDADRIGLYDDRGFFIDSHHIILLILRYLYRIKGKKGKVISTFSCSDKIPMLAKLYGLPSQITKIGFKYIGEIMANEEVLIGGEESGGIAVAGHIPERDGIYIGLLILEMMAKTGKRISELIQEVYDEVGPFAVERNDLHLLQYQKEIILTECKNQKYKAFGPYNVLVVEDLDGYKFRLDERKWVMIRPSGTEPLLRIYAESDNSNSAKDILYHATETIKETLSNYVVKD